MKESGEKIRCFVIADDYRWHVLTDSLEEFYKASVAYITLMNESSKENHYYFKNIFLDEEEYYQILGNMNSHVQRNPNTENSNVKANLNSRRERKVPLSSHLRLV